MSGGRSALPLVRELLAHAEAHLTEHAVPAAGWDAERLLRHALGWNRARLYSESDTPIAIEVAARFDELVAARARRVPLQHIVGVQEFWRHEFEVSSDALIPRPETELLVEEALKLLAGTDSPRVVDVGTGSGCIALSLAAERPDAHIVACDVSLRALGLATRNAARLDLSGHVPLVASDLLGSFGAERCFDLVVSNPPYAARSDSAGLAPEVRDYEPTTALYGGEDGLAIYRRLLPQARARLRPGGHLALEIGMDQDEPVRALCEKAGLRVLRVMPDLQGIPRVVVAVA